MARGATTPAPGPAPAGAPAPGGDQPPAVPEKYLVKNEDGSTNWEASALKQAQGYGALANRLGSGEARPATPEDYAPELPAGLTMDALKGDPMFAGFLKGAHAKGLNNGQVSYILSEFQQRMSLMEQQRNDPGVAEAELSKVWTTPQQMQSGLANGYRAAQAFAESPEHAAQLEAKFGNDPDFIRLMARIGGELGEDKPVVGLTNMETETLESLKLHPAYSDARHPEHRVIAAKVSALYQKMVPNA